MSVHVTDAAIAAYIDRVAPVEPAEAYAEIVGAERGIDAAAWFGGHVVKLGNGVRLIVRGRQNARVVTVYAKGVFEGGNLAHPSAPVCCGLCGLRCTDPVARACTRAECPLGHHRHSGGADRAAGNGERTFTRSRGAHAASRDGAGRAPPTAATTKEN